MTDRYDFTINKKAIFEKDIYLTDINNVPIDLTTKSVRCIIKESKSTESILFDLTNINGGALIIEPLLGHIRLFINTEDTDIEPLSGFYEVVIFDTGYFSTTADRLLEGFITFSEGLAT